MSIISAMDIAVLATEPPLPTTGRNKFCSVKNFCRCGFKSFVKNTKSILKIKTIAGSILKDTSKTQEDDEGISYLERWYNGKENDDEKARQVVVCSLIWGIITLLSLKHNLNFLDDKRNEERTDKIRYEIQKIMEYCGIDKDYLL